MEAATTTTDTRLVTTGATKASGRRRFPSAPQTECLFEAPASPATGVLSGVPGWWERRAITAGLRPPWTDWRLALAPPPVAIESSASGPWLEGASSFTLGEAYARALEASVRVGRGCHYTPERLATTLWSELGQVDRPPAGSIVDPACGAGALLVPVLRQWLADASGSDPAEALARVPGQIRGIDLDPLGVWLGNAILAAELLPLWALIAPARRSPLPQLLHVGDGLRQIGARAAITVMNPPYGRVRLSPEDRERWEESLFGHANRFGLFLHAAIDMTMPGGLIGAVLPTSFLGGSYYQRLRRLIADRAPLTRLVFVDERFGVFAGSVLQETCLAVFRRDAVQSDIACSMQPVNGDGKRRALGRAKVAPERAELPWLVPRAPEDAALLDRASTLDSRLSDYGWKASTGPLVWNRHKPQISSERTEGALPIVWASDLAAGRVQVSCARATQRWIRLRPRDAFMRLDEPAVLVQRTTAPEQPRRLVASLLDAATLADVWGGSVVVENHVNVLRCANSAGPLTPEVLAALLSSGPVDRLYRCLTGSVAVSAYELAALPLPPAETLRTWQNTPPDEILRLAAELYG